MEAKIGDAGPAGKGIQWVGGSLLLAYLCNYSYNTFTV